jgi:peptidyl-prolyl cis-trans isomerase A (cyclophilin A)
MNIFLTSQSPKILIRSLCILCILPVALSSLHSEEPKKETQKPSPAETQPNPIVEITTSMGSIQVELYRKKSPITVANFLAYVKGKHYDGTIFHRVIENFMIQGGGFAKGDIPAQKTTKAPIKNEASTSGLSNVRGTIAMARTSAPDSATAQFFINVVNNKNLDAGGFSPDGYAVFGMVVSGMQTVDKIQGVDTASKSLKTAYGERPVPNVPLTPVIIESVSLKK